MNENLQELFLKQNIKDIYIKGLENYIRELRNKAKENNIKTKEIENRLNIRKYTFNWWYRQGFPLNIFDKLNKIYFELTRKELPINEILYSCKGTRHKSLRLPEKLNEDLAYLMGYILGDGHLSNYKKSLRLELYDVCKEHIINMKSLFKRYFNINRVYIFKDRGNFVLRINSKVLLTFLNKIFEIPIGKKEKIKIPLIIKEKDLIKEFIAGFFDAEGCIYHNKKYGYSLTISQYRKEILEEIKDYLKSIDIYSKIRENRASSFELKIPRKENTLNFSKKIKLKNPNKILTLNKFLKGENTMKLTWDAHTQTYLKPFEVQHDL